METQTKNTRRKFIGTLALGTAAGITAMATPIRKATSYMTTGMNEADAWLPATSVATQTTVVTPFGKAEPDGGLQATVAPGTLSVTVTV